MLSIPSGIFTKYEEAMTLIGGLSGFGIPCSLVYDESVEETTGVPQVKQRKVMNLEGGSSFNRAGTSFKSIETTEDITLRVYWTKKDFKKMGYLEAPDNSILTIGSISDLPKINRCKALLVQTDKTGNVEWRFVRSSEPEVHGLTSNHFICLWGRA